MRRFFFLALVCMLMGTQPIDKAVQARDARVRNLKSPFGVLSFLPWNDGWNNHQYPDSRSRERAVKLMKQAGVGFVRMDFYWEKVEPMPGDFHFEQLDEIVDLLTRYDIHILGLLHYSAPWASSCGKWNCAPKDDRLFVTYARAVIARYKDRVKHWEVWNEPDSHTYWNPQDGMKGYVELLKAVYTAAKEEDPQCVILNGGLSKGLSSVNRLYDNGAKDYFDVLNIHIFETPVNPSAIEAAASYPRLAAKVMERNGDGMKKIWVTEIGCPGVPAAKGTADWWAGRNPTEKEQAEWVHQVYARLTDDPHVEKIFWAFFRDTDRHWGNGTDNLGLIRHDFSKKPSYVAYLRCFKQWVKQRTIK